jgi:hypothetical protein
LRPERDHEVAAPPEQLQFLAARHLRDVEQLARDQGSAARLARGGP